MRHYLASRRRTTTATVEIETLRFTITAKHNVSVHEADAVMQRLGDLLDRLGPDVVIGGGIKVTPTEPWPI